MKFDIFKPCHVIVRAVDSRPIFSDEKDCSRYIIQIYATNIGKPSYNIFRKDVVFIANQLLEGDDNIAKIVVDEKDPLVDILSFALVGDHAHFILSPNIENGIAKYVHKINLSFAKYYNNRHQRQGILFNKPYSIIALDSVEDLDKTMRYINVKNALDIYNPHWQDGIENWKEAFDFIDSYKYSSYLDLFGNRNSKILAPEPILKKYFAGKLTKDKIDNVDFIKQYIDKNPDYNKEIFLEE